MDTQHYVEHFASEMEKLRALDDKDQAKAIAYIAEDDCMKAIKSMALPCPCPCCGSDSLYFYRTERFCLLICGNCGTKKRRGESLSEFTLGSSEWHMKNLADAVTAWNQRAQKGAPA